MECKIASSENATFGAAQKLPIEFVHGIANSETGFASVVLRITALHFSTSASEAAQIEPVSADKKWMSKMAAQYFSIFSDFHVFPLLKLVMRNAGLPTLPADLIVFSVDGFPALIFKFL